MATTSAATATTKRGMRCRCGMNLHRRGVNFKWRGMGESRHVGPATAESAKIARAHVAIEPTIALPRESRRGTLNVERRGIARRLELFEALLKLLLKQLLVYAHAVHASLKIRRCHA